MKTLFISKEGTMLGKKGKRVVVEDVDIPLKEVKEVIIEGSVGMTGALTKEVLKHNIPVHYLSFYGTHVGHLMPRNNYDRVKIHQQQFKMLENEEYRVRTAKVIVKGKLENIRNFIMRGTRSTNSRSQKVIKSLHDIKNSIDKLETADSLDQIRGYEGSVARKYFSILPELLKDSMGFSGRNKRPPKDPVNSMLSYGYTLLFHKVLNAIYQANLNPYVGFYHDLKNGRASLAADLMEEYRQIIIDALVKKMINRQMVIRDDFDVQKDRVFLSKSLKHTYLREFDNLMEQKRDYYSTDNKHSWEQIILKQVNSYKDHLLGQSSYLTMGVR